jgi:hypothetical protein
MVLLLYHCKPEICRDDGPFDLPLEEWGAQPDAPIPED